MVLRDLKINTLRGLLIVSSLGFTACVDNDYDLSKDIDMTVTGAAEIALLRSCYSHSAEQLPALVQISAQD